MTSARLRPARLAAAVAVVAALATAAIAAPGVVRTADAKTVRGCAAPRSAVIAQVPATYRKNVALTFDDGPSKFTPMILDVLKREHVKATFFVTGRAVKANPALARRIVAEGHVIGNHTYSHPQDVAGSVPRIAFTRMSRAAQEAQMDGTTREIARATGKRPCFFRGPGGSHGGATTRTLARNRGMSIVGWTQSSGDWAKGAKTESRTKQRDIIRRATSPLSRHALVLFHDGKASPEPERRVSSNRINTVRALPAVIEFYRHRGYTFTDPAGHRLAR
ncbi:MAG TPA: polysaccharide deacetylase family protein [Mycobacteriales bacterium]